MRLSKSQLAVITVLNVVIAALLATVFLLPKFGLGLGGGGGVNDPDDGTHVDTPVTPDHDKLRGPSAGRVDGILRETRLMGSGDERIIDAFEKNGMLYVFGNATVGDYDFDAYGGFLCRIDGGGKICAFEYFTGRMTAVGVVDDGYAVATVSDTGTDNARNRLYHVGHGSTPREVATLGGTAVGIISVSAGKVAVVTRKTENSLRLTEYAVGDGDWAAGRNTDISSGYALEYFDCYVLGDAYVMAARASSLPRYDSVVFFTFEAGGDPSAHFYGGSGDSMLQPYAVMPCDSGYVILCRRNGTATIVSLNYAFTSYHRDILGFAFDDARLVFSGDKYYACFDCADGAQTYEFDAKLQVRKLLSATGGAIVDAPVKNAPSLIACKTKTATAVISVAGDKKVSFDITNAEVRFAQKNSDGTVTLVLSATGGAAVSAPTGGRDIYVVCIEV